MILDFENMLFRLKERRTFKCRCFIQYRRKRNSPKTEERIQNGVLMMDIPLVEALTKVLSKNKHLIL